MCNYSKFPYQAKEYSSGEQSYSKECSSISGFVFLNHIITEPRIYMKSSLNTSATQCSFVKLHTQKNLYQKQIITKKTQSQTTQSMF